MVVWIIGQGNVKELGGPIAIAEFSARAAQNGLLEFTLFMAFISINLGLINLFPIPVLDGDIWCLWPPKQFVVDL